MKKLATTLFGLFLVATSFANVSPVKTADVKAQEIVKTNINTPKTNTLLKQVNKVMTLTTVALTGGPRVVVQTCIVKCEDEL